MDQNIAKNYIVDVGDADAISEAIQKQKVNPTNLTEEKFANFSTPDILCVALNICCHPLICQKITSD